MRRAVAILVFALAACGGGSSESRPSREPVSVRGWIADVQGAAATSTFRTVETEAARRINLFKQTQVWIDNAPYVSGGVGENGSFILLDVPPGNVTVSFSAPGAEGAKLVLQNVPGNADVLIPGLFLTKTGVVVENPNQIRVRLAANIKEPRPTKLTTIVAGHEIHVIEAPLNAMVDRRDYPEPPAGYQPVAKVR